jgi:alpha-ketoglutarate-dependent taurine dioxygenase
MAERLDEISSHSPFSLGRQDTYLNWRERKIANYPQDMNDLIVPIASLCEPTGKGLVAIAERCRVANMGLYSCTEATEHESIPAYLRELVSRFGIREFESHRSAGEHGVVALEVSDTGTRKGYIPYSDRPLSWHTDGYYNAIDLPVRSFVLHCVRAAGDGGHTELLDPEIVYIRLRDRDPSLIEALMHPGAMTIPANEEPDGHMRPQRTGPVFSVDPVSGSLHMRYSARSRNIVWRDDAATTMARNALRELMDGSEPLIHRLKLQPGQGLICNNVLHRRTGFKDPQPGTGKGRLLYRLRSSELIGAPTAAHQGAPA